MNKLYNLENLLALSKSLDSDYVTLPTTTVRQLCKILRAADILSRNIDIPSVDLQDKHLALLKVYLEYFESGKDAP